MVRIPATLVGLLFALILGILAFVAARRLGLPHLTVVLLPVCAAGGGFIAARWARYVAQVPGLTVGLLFVAVQMGMGMGMHNHMLAFIEIELAIVLMIAAITGGLIGTLWARKANQPVVSSDTESPALF